MPIKINQDIAPREILRLEKELVEKKLHQGGTHDQISQKIRDLILNTSVKIIDPPIDDSIVSLGSKVTLKYPDAEYSIGIVGIIELGSDQDIDYCLPTSPIAKVILGQTIGKTVELTLSPTETIPITILEIDQESIINDLVDEIRKK